MREQAGVCCVFKGFRLRKQAVGRALELALLGACTLPKYGHTKRHTISLRLHNPSLGRILSRSCIVDNVIAIVTAA